MVAEGDGGELYIFLTAKKTIPLRRKSFMTAKTMPFFCVTANKRSFGLYPSRYSRQAEKAKEVVMVETLLGDNIKDSYFADMKIVDHIPVDWSLIGLSTWEKALAGKQS